MRKKFSPFKATNLSRVNLISVKNPFRIVKSLMKDGEPNKREDYKIGEGLVTAYTVIPGDN